jgi:hypothetical protein
MPLTIAHRRARERLLRTGDGALLRDLTSRGSEPWVRFSPFYPHGDIPVPFSPGATSMSVEGIWQALKVFESADVDRSKLEIANMRGLKRTVRRFGPVLGHRNGLDRQDLLSYIDARRLIYLPAYRWILENRVKDLVEELRAEATTADVVLLDYTTNADVEDVTRPLSHAGLVARYIEDRWPWSPMASARQSVDGRVV